MVTEHKAAVMVALCTEDRDPPLHAWLQPKATSPKSFARLIFDQLPPTGITTDSPNPAQAGYRPN